MKALCVSALLFVIFNIQCSALDLSAKSAILYEPETKTILFEKNAYEKRAIASTTKIMTAVVVLENAKPDEIVEVSKNNVGIEGTSIYLEDGERLSVLELLYGMLLQSGNDAATALAEYVGLKAKNEFVCLMNEKAEELGMKNTSFENPSGLPAEGHFSTAYDMALLTSYAMRNLSFAEIVRTKSYSSDKRTFINHNKLLRLYEGATGVKTGYTKAAGRCLVSSAERDGMTLIAVTLSAPDDWEDHRKLFDFGFSNYSINKFDEDSLHVLVAGGESDFIKIKTVRNVSVLANKENSFSTEIFLPRFVYAPIKEGDIVGEIRYIIDGEIVERDFVVSVDDVAYKVRNNMFKRLFMH